MNLKTLSLSFVIAISTIISSYAQDKEVQNVRFEPLPVDTKASFRGLFAVNDSVVWAAGSEGTVIKTVDGGESWDIFHIPDADSVEFRDIHAFSDQKAYALTAGQPARIYATTDGGSTWVIQYENKNPQAFFDGFDFWNENEGIAMSDPVDGKILIIYNKNGKDWQAVNGSQALIAQPNEGSYAASGTTVVVGKNGVARIAVSGTNGSRVLYTEDFGNNWKSIPNPVHSELKYAGIYSMAFRDDIGIAVGGSFAYPDSTLNHAAISRDGGKSWELLAPHSTGGYRSCVAWLPFTKSSWFTVSRAGGEFTNDNGQTWTAYDPENTYYSFSIASNGTVGYASGANGKIAKVHFETKNP